MSTIKIDPATQQKYIQSRRYIDDEFFSLALNEQCRCCEEILRPILHMPNLKVIRVQTQRYYTNLGAHSVRLDILAEDEDGKLYNIEIQRAAEGASPKRGRFYLGSVDTAQLGRGADYANLADVYIIFLMERDPFGHGFPVYHVDKVIRESGEPYFDGSHLLYVNGGYAGDDALGNLMRDLKCADPDKIRNPHLRTRMRFLKETPEGAVIVSNDLQKLIEEGRRDLQERLEEKDTQLKAKDTQLEEKDTQLEEKDTQLKAKDTQLEEKDTQLEEKNIQIKEQAAQLAKLRQYIASKGLQMPDLA